VIGRCLAAGLLCAGAMLAPAPGVAAAALVIPPGTTTFETLNAAGQPETRAGAHPDRLVQEFVVEETDGAVEHIKDLRIDLPAGLGGDLGAVPACPRAIFFSFGPYAPSCKEESRVGTMFSSEGSERPVYSVPPGADEAATFALKEGLLPLVLHGRIRSQDQGLSLHLENVARDLSFAFGEGRIELWGVPADHQKETSIPRRPLLTLPSRCDGRPLSVTVNIRTWQHPERWLSDSGNTGHPLTDCAGLGFEPRLGFSLGDPRADVPTGAGIELALPPNDNPDGRAGSQIEDVSVVMPEGMTVSPGGAGGLSACSDAELGLGNSSPPACPPSSRIGTVELDTGPPLEPMAGAIYLGEEQPGDRFRLLIAAGGRGTEMKMVGSLKVDPKTGRLTTTLNDLPQAYFASMRLRFDGGPGALLASPLDCGTATATASFVPSSGGPSAARAAAVDIARSKGACAGPAPFEPSFAGGSTQTRAGGVTSFTTTVRRRDGEQLPARLGVTLPPGMSAALGTVELCPPAPAACPAASQIGSAVAELGPGTSPARIHGKVFLTGPYRRAPFGVALAFDASFGPLDLGTLVVRGALRIDPLSGQVRIEMDSLPTIFEGIPIRFQTIGLDLDRPGFMRNPTSCAPAQVIASLRSPAGALATPSSPFTLHRCIDLPFRPGFSVALGGSRRLHEGDRPSLRMSMRLPAGSANLRSVRVLLPSALGFDSKGLKELCSRHRALEGTCPRRARVGTAHARTPMLARPMSGFLYIVQPSDDGAPDLWASLAGQGLEVNLPGETAIRDGQAETSFSALPDFALRSLSLRLAGGDGGILKLKQDPCGKLVAPAELGGQNGARRTLRPRLKAGASCKGHE
jgi:hypothetical protein